MRLRQAKKIWKQPWLVPVMCSIGPLLSGQHLLGRSMRRMLRSSRHKKMILDFITSQEDWVQRLSKSAAPMAETQKQAFQELADQAQELKMGYETAADEAEPK